MENVVRTVMVRSTESEPARPLRMAIACHSTLTLVRRSSACSFRGLQPLTDGPPPGRRNPRRIFPVAILPMEVKLLDRWFRQEAYVVDDVHLGGDYDLLVGSDFLQAFGIRFLPDGNDLVIDPAPRHRSLEVPAPAPDDELYCPACEEG